jgi:thymidylate synthase (FAD)
MKGKILVELQEWMGSDASIANAAWTSTYDKSSREDKYDDPDKVASLVPRLIRDGHSVPIESVILRFWIRHPIFNDRQHMTHRIASHNGLSGRYRTLPEDWYSIPEDCVGILNRASVNGNMGDLVKEEFDTLCARANYFYKSKLEMLKNAEKVGNISNDEYKRCREILRGVLPVAGMVERTSILNLRSFANYQRLRNSSHAQLEIRSVAQMMLEEVKKAGVAPIAIATLEEMKWSIG